MLPLHRVFLQQPPIATIRLILIELISEKGQEEIVNALANTNDLYRNEVLKLFVSLIEQNSGEVIPEIWEIYYELKTPAKIKELQSLKGTPQEVCYELANNQQIKIVEQRQSLIESGETGHRTWESSLALCEYICVHYNEFKSILNSQTIVELGAGTGLLSLALSKLFNSTILATDGSPAIVHKLEQSIELNKANINVDLVDWTIGEDVQRLPHNAIVFAGDILYGLESVYPAIIKMLTVIKPLMTYFCNPIRNLENYTKFKTLCKNSGFKVTKIKSWACADPQDTEYMFLVSVPPIEVELILIERV